MSLSTTVSRQSSARKGIPQHFNYGVSIAGFFIRNCHKSNAVNMRLEQ